MKYTTLENTNIKVSKICIGCMSFGKRGTIASNPKQGVILLDEKK